MQQLAARQLSIIATGCLQDIVLRGTRTREFYGPHRIAVAFEVQPRVSSIYTKQRGPKSNAPDVAIEGFLRKQGGTHQSLQIEDDYFVLFTQTPERSAYEVVQDKLPEHLRRFPWPKSMRWGQSGEFTWIRPLRRIVCLLDGEVVPIKLGAVTAGDETEGHPVMAPKAFAVSSARDWEEKLLAHRVYADEGKRKRLIRDGLAQKAKALGFMILEDVGLLDEVTGLVEWPVPLIGRIDVQFMSLPPEVRELSMKINQKYFALRDAEDKPAPYFGFVANQEAPDGGAAIIVGNERVLRARLADARHFWDLDLKTPLNELLPKLDGITFHVKIGTQRERAERIAVLARKIAGMLHADANEAAQAEWAGRLCKADLVTGMVGEFPELQGIMGGYYAEQEPRGWEGTAVGTAIRTHYQPKGPDDDVPEGVVAASVALADKLDVLQSFFRIGEKPTGSGDPYALRRAALGIVRIIRDNGIHLSLKALVSDLSLFDFLVDRARFLLKSEGKRHDVLSALFAAGEGDDLLILFAKTSALTAMLQTDNGVNLLAGYRRVANILKAEEGADGQTSGHPNPKLFNQVEERTLHNAILHSEQIIGKNFDDMDYSSAMIQLSLLRGPIDTFFSTVVVNAAEPELRLNRLRLLAQLRDTMHQIADFSKIEV